MTDQEIRIKAIEIAITFFETKKLLDISKEIYSFIKNDTQNSPPA